MLAKNEKLTRLNDLIDKLENMNVDTYRMPNGDRWNYGTCDTCAMALTLTHEQMLGTYYNIPALVPILAEHLGISARQAEHAFVHAGHQLVSGLPEYTHLSEVKPKQVAAVLRRIRYENHGY